MTRSRNLDPAGTLSGVLFPRRRARAVLDNEDRVIAGAFCITCGADLEGLTLTERCNDCAHPVSDSIHGDFLIYAERDRVLRLSDAARFVKFGAVFLAALVVLATIGQAFRAGSFESGVGHALNVMLAGAFILPILATAGIFTLTARRSAAYYKAVYGRRETLTRLAWLTLLVIAIVSACFWLLPTVTRAVLVALWATIPVVTFLSGLENLLRRVPNVALAGMARVLLILSYVSGGALLAVLLMREWIPEDASRRPREILSAVTLLTILGGIMVSVAGVRMLMSVENVLRKAAR